MSTQACGSSVASVVCDGGRGVPCTAQHSMVYAAGSLFVFGGTVSAAASHRPLHTGCASACVVAQTGASGTGEATNGLYKFNPTTCAWTALQGADCAAGGVTRPECRYEHTAVFRPPNTMVRADARS